jgi:hypothetical protein
MAILVFKIKRKAALVNQSIKISKKCKSLYSINFEKGTFHVKWSSRSE